MSGSASPTELRSAGTFVGALVRLGIGKVGNGVGVIVPVTVGVSVAVAVLTTLNGTESGVTLLKPLLSPPPLMSDELVKS